MATTMETGPLNDEPADPKQRAQLDLPPKSFADAAHEALEETQGKFDSNASSGYGSHAHSPQHSNSFSYASSTTTAADDQEKIAHSKQLDADKVSFERHVAANGMDVLTTVKPDTFYEENFRHNDESAPREKRKENSEISDHQSQQGQELEKQKRRGETEGPVLASGRQAGAGWQRSA